MVQLLDGLTFKTVSLRAATTRPQTCVSISIPPHRPGFIITLKPGDGQVAL